MAQRTQLVYSDTPGAVPASYKVPPSLDLVLQSVVVRWNGTAAAGAFLPTLAVYSQDGKLVGRFHPGTQLEAGDTGVVTYAPFLKQSASPGVPGSAYVQLYAWDETFACAALPNATEVRIPHAPSWISNSDIFDIDYDPAAVGFCFPGEARVLVTSLGAFGLVVCHLAVHFPSFVGPRYIRAEYFLTSTATWTPFMQQGAAGNTPEDDWVSCTGAVPIPSFFGLGAFPVKIRAYAYQASGAGKTAPKADSLMTCSWQPFDA